jgi:hypothetical protein
MKVSLFAAVTLAAACVLPANAVDHNNIDAGRPLDFDDADAVAYREKALEFGAALSKSHPSGTALEGAAEFLYGFAPNSHFSLDFHPQLEHKNGTSRFDAGDVGIGVFHNFNREFGNTPALSLRADASLPTGRDARGVDLRLRGIASRQFRQYGRLHLNFDWNINHSPRAGERHTLPGVIFGYSQPLGYPTKFDRTLVAQAGYRAHADKGQKGITTLGIGLRQQIGVQSVFDIGLKSEVSGGRERKTLEIVTGVSKQF